jgi:amino acid permease
MGVVFGVVAFVGMIFPYIKRDVYETSPARVQVAGIPLMTITGFIGTVVTAFIIYRAFVDDTYAANSSFSIWMIVTVFVVSAVWYFVAREVRRRQGVDMDARYKEIPVE